MKYTQFLGFGGFHTAIAWCVEWLENTEWCILLLRNLSLYWDSLVAAWGQGNHSKLDWYTVSCESNERTNDHTFINSDFASLGPFSSITSADSCVNSWKACYSLIFLYLLDNIDPKKYKKHCCHFFFLFGSNFYMPIPKQG